MKTHPTLTNFLFCAALAFGMAACSSAAGPSQVPTTEPTLAQTETPTPGFSKQQEIEANWRRGPHSKTFDQSMSEQPDCARCHSPQDWDPAATGSSTDPACLAYLPAADVAQGAAAESAYHYVSCDVCHTKQSNGEITGELAWWNPETKTSEPVSGPSELCLKCHTDTPVAKNGIDLGQGPHAALECTACHDPHRLDASCTDGGCHPSVAEDMKIIKELAVLPGHEVTDMHTCGSGLCHPMATQVAKDNKLQHIGLQHAVLNCTACHDASGLPRGPQEDGFHWTTWQTMTGLDGQEYQRPYYSHDLQRSVDCTQCHYDQNPWDLPFPVKAAH